MPSPKLTLTPSEYIEELSGPHNAAATAVMRAAGEQRELLTEPLLSALSSWADQIENSAMLNWHADRQPLADRAMYLLAQFREPRAFPLYLQLCRLNEERLDYALSDILTEDMPAMLASTCHARLPELQALLADESVAVYARWAGLNALLTIVAQGDGLADELADALLQIAEHQARSPLNPYWNMLASAQHDLLHPSLTPVVWQAYHDQLIDPFGLLPSELEARLQLPQETALAEFRQQHDYLRDAAQAMEWFLRTEDDDDHADDYFPQADLDMSYTPTYVRDMPKIGRNDPCPCGSGKKHKKCCLNADPFAA